MHSYLFGFRPKNLYIPDKFGSFYFLGFFTLTRPEEKNPKEKDTQKKQSSKNQTYTQSFEGLGFAFNVGDFLPGLVSFLRLCSNFCVLINKELSLLNSTLVGPISEIWVSRSGGSR